MCQKDCNSKSDSSFVKLFFKNLPLIRMKIDDTFSFPVSRGDNSSGVAVATSEYQPLRHQVLLSRDPGYHGKVHFGKLTFPRPGFKTVIDSC